MKVPCRKAAKGHIWIEKGSIDKLFTIVLTSVTPLLIVSKGP